ncbi:MAG: [FeFe] hydrogenase H-cluster radical SAM maturase HydE [Victivallaceae bacterium]|nr:[FeFe] hydrogenase H-cluster radical SAM maturase HydE [Victivallaceae bacterium]
MELQGILDKAKATRRRLSGRELEYLLSLDSESEQQRLFDAAYEIKLAYIGKKVSIRGLIEMGNVCAKNCYYCGIRRGNTAVRRFELDIDAIERMARWAYEHRYGSLVLQSGEVESEKRTEFVEEALRRIMKLSGGRLGITLSLGEQRDEVYRRWHEAGARRYLLRLETSSPAFYRELHPADHNFFRRRRCLSVLRRIGYQVGSGVMIGLPGQTLKQLARDLEFFGRADLDMIGMGPYLPHHATPLGKDIAFTPEYRRRQLLLGLKTVAVCRLYLHDVNIASTTALQALAPDGRERGLLAGANVVMPNITDTCYRKDYFLYENKPGSDENSAESLAAFERSIANIGEEILWGEHGDSKHYFSRTGADD